MSDPVSATPPIEAVVETAISADDVSVAEQFYTTVLGLPKISSEAGRYVFFRVGPASVLLGFNADATLKGGHLPPHGARGPAHFALGVPTHSFDAWRDHLTARGILIEQEVSWAVVVLSRSGRQLGRVGDSGRVGHTCRVVRWTAAEGSTERITPAALLLMFGRFIECRRVAMCLTTCETRTC